METLAFKKVRCPERSTDDAIKVTLYRDEAGWIRGWYIGPVQFTSDGVQLPYLPRSKRALGSVAVVRAIEEAEKTGGRICIVDPDDLWEPTWKA